MTFDGLLKSGFPRELKTMLDLLEDPSQTVRAAACWSLGILGDTLAAPALAAAAADDTVMANRWYGQAAAFSLSYYGQLAALELGLLPLRR